MYNIYAKEKVQFFFKNFGLIYTLKKIYFFLISILKNFFFDRFKLLRIFFLYKTSYYFYYKKIDDLRLDKNSTVLDFGANVGNFSRYINDKFKSKLYLYEPNPHCCKILRKRFFRHPNIKIYNYGVSNVNAFNNFYMTVYDKSGFSLSEGCSFDKSKKNINLNNFLRVRVVNIIDILKKYKHINLLKIDIEGSEYKIINYIIKNIKKIDVVFCEFHKTTYLQKKKYINIINFLKKKKLYNSKVYTWI